MYIVLILSALMLFKDSISHTIKGNCLQNKLNFELNLKLYLNDEKESRVDQWGNFVFYDIEEGFHTLRVGSVKSFYPEYQINIQNGNT